MAEVTELTPHEFENFLNEGSDEIAKILKRRITYLVNELRSAKPTRDQSVTYTQRVISNYLTIGSDMGSARIIRQNRFASTSAISVMQTNYATVWSKYLTNEHPIPLFRFWRKLNECAQDCTDCELYKFFALTRMVTVTKEEDRLINQNGYRQSGLIKQRYKYVSAIRELEKPPIEACRTKHFESVETEKLIDFDSLV